MSRYNLTKNDIYGALGSDEARRNAVLLKDAARVGSLDTVDALLTITEHPLNDVQKSEALAYAKSPEIMDRLIAADANPNYSWIPYPDPSGVDMEESVVTNYIRDDKLDCILHLLRVWCRVLWVM